MNTENIYVDGQWIPSSGQDLLDVVNPTTAEVVAQVPAGTPQDVDAAVAAAKAAFLTWSTTSPAERAAKLRQIADGITARGTDIVAAAVQDIGCTPGTANYMSVYVPSITFNDAADLAESTAWESRDGALGIVREPVGVVAAITPWNYPLHQIAAKVAPALAAGCTVVLKPSEVAPLTAWIFAEIVDAVGLPAGVFNMVGGLGPVVGEALAAHPDVDMVSLTGSIRAGARVSELASATVKRVTLELGGKSANLILSDVADITPIVAGSVNALLSNAGQTCSALTRLIVPREKLAEAERIAADTAADAVIGDPAADGTTLGPVVSQTQYERVRNYIAKGIEEGAKLVAGGLDKPVDQGFFVAPTVFSDVKSSMAIAQEEIFGPVLSILPYDTEDEAVQIANDSRYGLSGAVWAADEAGAVQVAKRLRTGQVKINGGAFNPRAPFGGYKQSGVGRELGAHGLDEYLETKALTF